MKKQASTFKIERRALSKLATSLAALGAKRVSPEGIGIEIQNLGSVLTEEIEVFAGQDQGFSCTQFGYRVHAGQRRARPRSSVVDAFQVGCARKEKRSVGESCRERASVQISSMAGAGCRV